MRPGGRRLDLVDVLLIVEFSAVVFATYPGSLQFAGVDAATYWTATQRWLSGDDPYRDLAGLVFAAPPPTLVILAPFTWLPMPVFQALMSGGSILAAIVLLRRLHLPFWFLLFPPIVEAVIVGNPNVFVVTLLVLAQPAADAIAVFLKLYALLPIGFLLRWRSLVVAVALLLMSAPFLPWASYLEHAGQIALVLDVQSKGGRSAFAFPLLIPFTLAALVILGRNRAAWLVVPGLWPATQYHYSALALPAMSRLMAAIMAIPIPGSQPVAIFAEATAHLIRRRRNRDRVAEAAEAAAEGTPR